MFLSIRNGVGSVSHRALTLPAPCKDDLKISDFQLGILGGFVFALFYSALGLPIARHLAAMSGGSLELAPAENGNAPPGAHFLVTLPRDEAHP